MPKQTTKSIQKILQANAHVDLDIGCGENKMPNTVGIDYRAMPGVDIVHDLTKFPWPIPSGSIRAAVSNHVVEHIPPFPPDARLVGLIQLLLKKKIISAKDVKKYVGEVEPGPIFIRFMDEVWRILKDEGEFGMTFPYGSSPGFLQDPTHINSRNEVTWWYFDPLEKNSQGMLYRIYKPKPWKIKLNAYTKDGNMEVVLVKRREDKSYETGPSTI